MPTDWLEVTEPGPHTDWILIEDEYDNAISISRDTGLELAYLLMSICKGQGSSAVHRIPKDTPNV